jgi:hypothetical protein
MWVIQFNVLRGGERSPEDGAPREFLDQNSPFPLPDIDQTVLHRGEAFVVDDVIWDLERKTVTVELVPSDEADVEPKPAQAGAAIDEDFADDGDEDFTDADGGEAGDDGADFDEGIDPQAGEPDAPEAPPAEDEQPTAQEPPRKGRQRVRGPAAGSGTRRGDARPE